jgi:hypothetical protein
LQRIEIININSTEPVHIRKQGITLNATSASLQEGISTQKPKYNKVLCISSEIDFLKVRTFLESMGRNSRNSKATHETELTHFQRFLGSGRNDNYQNYNVESTLSALQAGSITGLF